MLVYKLYTLDIWGNETDGYDLNDSFFQGNITLNENFTESELLDAIDSLIGLFGKEHAEIDDYQAQDFIEIRDKSSGMPVFHLYLDEEDSVKKDTVISDTALQFRILILDYCIKL